MYRPRDVSMAYSSNSRVARVSEPGSPSGQEEIDEATQVRSNEDSTSESLVGFGRSREDRSSLADPPFSGIYTSLISV